MATIEQKINDGLLKWSQGVDPTDTDSAREYIEYKLLEYEYHDFLDADLWDQFKEDFMGFTEESLKASTLLSFTHRLHSFLRNRGVWVLKDKNITIAKSLCNTIKEEDQIRWTQEELLEHKLLDPRLNYLLRHEKKTTSRVNTS